MLQSGGKRIADFSYGCPTPDLMFKRHLQHSRALLNLLASQVYDAVINCGYGMMQAGRAAIHPTIWHRD